MAYEGDVGGGSWEDRPEAWDEYGNFIPEDQYYGGTSSDIGTGAGGIDTNAGNILNDNPNAFEFDWTQYGDREAQARRAMQFAQKYGSSKHFNPSTGVYDSWWPGDEISFQDYVKQGGFEKGMLDTGETPMSYQDFISGHQQMAADQGFVQQKELERSKPFGKFKWGQGLLDAAQNLTDTAANIKPYKYELF